ncbi:MAG: GGDEF domain-containing protein, partial [bacterium]
MKKKKDDTTSPSRSTRDDTSPHSTGGVSDGKTVARARFFPVLICFEGAHRGERFRLTKETQIIGRGDDADIKLEDELSSRHHSKLTYKNWEIPAQPPECYLEDLGSKNGTELNGQLVRGLTQLKERDRLLVGSSLFGFFFRDEEELQFEKSLFEMATRDALTGLDNRHQFTSNLTQQMEQSRRYKRPLSLLIADIDHFKKVNDAYGHDIGNKCLVHLARLIKSLCRRSEVCARWGGEEFGLLLPESKLDGAISVAERIREKIEAS